MGIKEYSTLHHSFTFSALPEVFGIIRRRFSRGMSDMDIKENLFLDHFSLFCFSRGVSGTWGQILVAKNRLLINTFLAVKVSSRSVAPPRRYEGTTGRDVYTYIIFI